VRGLITAMVNDVIAHTSEQIEIHKPQSPNDVRRLGQCLVDFSPAMHKKNAILQGFLSKRMYKHEKVSHIMLKARRVIADLFDTYMNEPDRLPENWNIANLPEDRKARQICDYIAGMTDRYALDQHKALFDLDPLFR
jgi:dGTPase